MTTNNENFGEKSAPGTPQTPASTTSSRSSSAPSRTCHEITLGEFEEAKGEHMDIQGSHTVLVKMANESPQIKKMEPESIYALVKAKLESSTFNIVHGDRKIELSSEKVIRSVSPHLVGITFTGFATVALKGIMSLQEWQQQLYDKGFFFIYSGPIRIATSYIRMPKMDTEDKVAEICHFGNAVQKATIKIHASRVASGETEELNNDTCLWPFLITDKGVTANCCTQLDDGFLIGLAGGDSRLMYEMIGNEGKFTDEFVAQRETYPGMPNYSYVMHCGDVKDAVGPAQHMIVRA